MLKMRFKESKCKFLQMKTSSRLGWPYIEMLGLLTLPARDRHNFTRTRVPKQVPRKIMVRDLDDVLKAQTYFYHHNLDKNRNGSELTTVKELSLYMNITSQPVNIRRIIYADMDEITHSMRRKF